MCLEDGTCHCWGNGDAISTCELDPLDCVIRPQLCHARLGYCHLQRRRCYCHKGSVGNGLDCEPDPDVSVVVVLITAKVVKLGI